MKKSLLLSFLLLFFLTPLFSIQIENSNAIQSEYREIVEKTLINNLGNRIDENIIINSFSIEDYQESKYLVTLSFNILNENYKVLFIESNKNRIAKILEEEIIDSLTYVETNTTGYKIDYIFNASIIALNKDPQIKVGDNYLVKDINNKAIARLVTDEVGGDFTRFSSIYNKSLNPGFSLTKINAFEINLGINFNLANKFIPKTISLNISNHAWLYPISPILSLRVNYLQPLTFNLGLGINYEHLLSSFSLDGIFLIKNAAIGSSSIAYLTYSNGFGYAASFDIYYKLSLSNNFNVRIGYDYFVSVVNKVENIEKSVKVALGVRF